MRTRAAVLSLLVAVGVVLAGCGDDADAPAETGADEGDEGAAEEPAEEPTDADAPEAEDPAAEDPAAEDPAADDAEADADAADPAADGDADLAVATTDLGDVLVDSEGMTLYLFTEDSDGQSVCEDDCAAAWPPLVVDGEPAAGDGLDASLVATTERSDGSVQVTYGGAPLYTWASDREPGDVTGQGVSDVWFVVSPDGEAITEAEADDVDAETDAARY